jgi:putative addiction module component
MSFAEVLNELPTLTFEQRQMLIRRAVEIDDPPLSPEDEALIEERIAAHEKDPSSSISWEEFDARLKRRLGE